MRKFIIHILLFLLLVSSIVVVISLRNADAYWATRVPVIKSELDLSGYNKIILVLGSSHSYNGINPKLISDSCFNLASPSQGYVEDFHVLKQVNRSKKVGEVILPLSFPSNHFYLDRSSIDGEYMRIYDYEKVYHVDYAINYKYIKYKLSLLKEFVNLKPAYLFTKKDFDENGNFKWACTQKEFSLADSMIVFKRHSRNSNFNQRHPYLDSIINYCDRERIKLNIVVFPFSKGYRNQVVRYRPGFKTFVRKLSQVPGFNIHILDYQDLFQENEEIYFKDADHLSPCGRDTFSIFLRNKLQGLSALTTN